MYVFECARGWVFVCVYIMRFGWKFQREWLLSQVESAWKIIDVSGEYCIHTYIRCENGSSEHLVVNDKMAGGWGRELLWKVFGKCFVVVVKRKSFGFWIESTRIWKTIIRKTNKLSRLGSRFSTTIDKLDRFDSPTFYSTSCALLVPSDIHPIQFIAMIQIHEHKHKHAYITHKSRINSAHEKLCNSIFFWHHHNRPHIYC